MVTSETGNQAGQMATGSGEVWNLIGLDGIQQSQNFRIKCFPFSVGRCQSSELSLSINSLSKNHAELWESESGKLKLRDLGSTNGTFVNGKRIKDECEVGDGDIVQFATVLFRLSKTLLQQQSNTVARPSDDATSRLFEFQRVLDEKDFFANYQPIVSLRNRDVMGYEVLGRSSASGLKTPAELFSVASQLECEILLSELLRQKGVEDASGLGQEKELFVNTHPMELDKPELYDSLKQLRECVPGQEITLEIHEGTVTNLRMMRELCKVLKDLDMKLAFDDFGVGQARLVELGEIRPDYLKFDMKLTQNIDQAPAKHQELVGLFANLVNNLGIVTLAEGVETLSCHEILYEMGFKLGQGFFYGRPSPAEDFCRPMTPVAGG